MRQAAVVFTRNRPSLLADTLQSISSDEIIFLVLDDSTTHATREETKAVISDCQDNIRYHGLSEQRDLVAKLPVSIRESRVLASFGQKRWTLGFNRNYALLLAEILNLDELLFLDDDIKVKSDGVRRAFKKLSGSPVVSGDIQNMIDDSIVGLHAQQVGFPKTSFLSGGFLAIDLEAVSHPFINVYNEDWIWGYFEQLSRHLPLVDGVEQSRYDIREKSKRQLYWQEFGEIIEWGLRSISNPVNEPRIRDVDYWKQVIEARRHLIESVYSMAGREMVELDCDQLMKYHTKVKPVIFSRIFDWYPAYLREWYSVRQSVKNIDKAFNLISLDSKPYE